MTFNLYSFAKATRAFTLATMCWFASVCSLFAITITVPGDQATIAAGIAAANPGDVVQLTANISEALVTINKAITLDGGGFTLTSTSPNWGVNVAVAGVTIQNLTVTGASTFGILTSCNADNLTVSNTTVTGCGGSGFALNGSDNLNLTDITSTNNVGNGVSITDCNNVTITGLTTSGNMFAGGFSAGVGIFSSGSSCPPAGTTNVTITGTVSIGEPIPVYEEVTAGSITGTSLPASLTTHFVGVATGAKFYTANLADAYTLAASLIAPPSSISPTLIHVEEISSGNKFVNDMIAPAPPQMGTYTLSIAAAITYATPGKIVFVEAGVYNITSTITVNKAITIQGPQADVDPRTTAGSRTPGSANEAVVNGGGTVGTIFNITVADVVLNGLEVTNSTGDIIASPAGAPVKTGVTVKYCIVHGSSADEGIQLRNVDGGGVQYCYVYSTAGDGINMCCASTNSFVQYNEVTDSDSGDGVIYLYNNGSGMQVTNNILYGNGGNDGIKIGIKSGADAALVSNAVVSNNTVTGQPQDGISIYTSSVTVSDNVITGSGSTNGALYLAFGISNVTITGNEIYNNNTRGIRLAAAVNAGTVTINQNSIYDNNAGLDNLSPQTVNAQLNWWGDASGPSGAGPGSGNSVSTNVLFCPWLDAPPPGGMPVSNTGAVHNIDSDEYFCSIQSAIDDAQTLSGHTLVISPGSYTEDVDATVLPKDLTFEIATTGCVTINGNFSINAGDVLEMNINGNTPCSLHDQFIVKGVVSLGGASLSITLGASLGSADQIVLIENDDNDPVIGQFFQGTLININGADYLINYSGGTGNDVVLSSLCGEVCMAPVVRVGNVTLNTQAEVNAFKDAMGCKYTEITGNLTINGNDAGDPITNLCNLQELTTVGGSLVIRRFTNGANPTDLNDLAKLVTVGNNLTIGGSAADQNTAFTSIILPMLNAVTGSINIAHNTVATNISIPSVFAAGSNAVTVQNNVLLNTLMLGVSTTSGNVTINTNSNNVTSINLPNLSTVGGNLNLSNNVANTTSAALGFPLLTTVDGSLNFTRTAKSIDMPNIASVGTTFTISSNAFDPSTAISFPLLTSVPGNFTMDGNSGLLSINIPGPFVGSTGAVSVETNTGIQSIVLGVSSSTSNVAIQSNGTALTTLQLNHLTSVDNNFDMNNNAANDVSGTAAVNLPLLATIGGRLQFVRAVNTLNIPLLTSVTGSYTFQRNAIVDLDATFPLLLTVGGNLNVTNNVNLAQCCIIPCKLDIGGTTTVNGNTGNCATLAIAIAACAPMISDFSLTEDSGTSDDGNVCNDGTDITLNVTATSGSGILNYHFFVDVNNDNLLDAGDQTLYDGPLATYTFSEAVLGGPGTYQVSVQVTVTGDACDAYSDPNLTIIVHDVPGANNATLTVCSTDPGGSTANFTLSDADADVTGGAMGVTVTYHATQDDADNNVLPLSSPYNTANTVVYARVENTAAGYCYATSEVTLTVTSTPDAGTITSGERLICENGDPIGFTATAVAGASYQWQFSQDGGMNWSDATGSGGVNNQNYNIPNGGVPDPELTTLYRRLITNGVGCTNISNSVTVYVNTFDVGIINAGTPQTVCVGDPITTIDGTAPTTISAPGLIVTTSYQWQQSNNGTSGWSNIVGADQEDYTPTGLTATRYFRRIVTVNVDGSGIPTNPTTVSCSKTPATWQAVVFVNTINPGTINMASGSNQQTICEGGDAGAFNTPPATVPAGATRTYLWQFRAKGSMDPWVDAPVPNDVEDYNAPAGSILFDAEFQRIVTSVLNGVSCQAITINNPTIDINEITDPGTITYAGDPDFSVCSGTAPLAFTGTAPDVDGTITYQWRSSITIDTPPLSNNVAGGTGQDLLSPPAITNTTHYGRRITSTLNGVSCQDFSNIITITVDPLPANPTVTPAGVQSFCTDAGSVDINYTITIPAGADEVEWSFDNFATVAGSTITGGVTLITVPAPTANPPGFVTTVVRFRTKNNLTGCVSGGINRSVRFYPPATADAGMDASICHDASVTLSGAIGGGATSGTWTASVAGGTFNPDNTFANAIDYTPPVGFSGTINLTLTTDNPAGPCGVSSDMMVLTVYAPLNTSITGASNVCINGSIMLSGSSTGGSGTIVTHDWTVTPGTGDATITTGSATAVLTGTAAGTITVTYTVTDDAGCVVVSTGTLAVNVDAAPSLTACPGNINLNTDLDECTSTWSWTHPNVLGVAASCAPATLEVDYGLGNGFETITPATSASQSFPSGTTTVSYKLTDGVGNMATCSFEVTVNDNQSPVITTCPVTRNISGCPADITGPVYSTTSAVSTYAEFSDATNQGEASDNCLLTVSYQDAATGTCPIVVTRTWTISDGTNAVTCDQTINVTPPVAVFAATADISVACGAAPPAPTGLSYTNGTSGICQISGSVMGNIAGSHTECGGSYIESWTYTDDCGRMITASRTITVDPAPAAAFATTTNMTIACGAAPPVGTVLSYTNGQTGACEISGSEMGVITGTHNECGGSYTETWTYVDDCARTITTSRTITVDPAPLAVFATTTNMTIACGTAPPVGTVLSYNNNETGACEISGSVTGVITGTHDECGGTYTETWTFVDGCSRTISTSRTITVDPAPLAVFATTTNMTIACGAAPPVGTVLSYTNGQTGACEISGSETGVITGGHTECGGSYTETWTYIDDCSRTITTSRTITVDPAPLAVFAPTMNMAIACGAAPPVGTVLSYTNSETGACEISGSATGVITGSHTECGGSYTETWTYTDDCARTITSSRTITVDPAPIAVFAATTNTTIACGAAPPVGTVLSYTNGQTGACEISGSVTGVISGGHTECGGSYTETWTFVDDCARTITASRTITVDPAPMAVFVATSNINIACGAAPPVGTSLSYTNSETGACEISGSAAGVITGGHTECGGSYTETWTYVDDCARTISTSRTITVDPAPVAVFAATSNINIACGAAPPVGTVLSYTNGQTGACEISGSETGAITGGHDECGGSYTETWTFVDGCARTITTFRTITVDPAPVAVFATTTNMTIACGAAPPTGTVLSYTNGETGACEISGSATGVITGTHNQCGGSYTETWTYVDDCSRTITTSRTITVDPAPVAVFATTTNTTIACGAAPPVSTVLSYTNGETGACEISGSVMGVISGGHTECGGSYTETWTYVDNCSRTITTSRTITVDPAPVAVFATTTNMTIACGAAPPVSTVLSYTNGQTGACEISGSATGVISGGHTECGGSYTETWTYLDDCARTITTSRTITVDPAPAAVFAPTMNTTIACGAAPPVGTSLSYTNSETGACEISGSTTGVITGSHTECGGSYTETWTFIDDCARTITASRTITVDPAPMAVFAATSNITIACGAAPPVGTSLSYTNGETGACLISGSVTGVITGSHAECGGSYTETWTFVDDCARTITASRTITVDPAPVAAFATTPNITIACGAAPPVGTSLSYTNGEMGACEISGSVTGGITGTHDECGGTYTETWTFVDDCARTITASRTITVDPAPMAVFAPTSDITISCESVPPAPTVLSYSNSASGVCEISGSVTSVITGNYTTCGDAFTETWTFVDDCNRTVSTARMITVVAPAPVSLNCPLDATVGACQDQVTVNDAFADWLDLFEFGGGCNAVGAFDGVPTAPSFCGGSVDVTYRVESDCESDVTCTRTFTVTPVAGLNIVCPGPQTQMLDAACQATLNDYTNLAVVSDACGTASVTQSPAAGTNYSGVPSATVTLTATDNCGTSSCSFTVTFMDATAPVAICPSNIVVSNDPAQCSAVVTFVLPAPSDNCSGATSTASPASGSTFPVGTTTVVVTATDASMNTSTCTFTVQVDETEAPTVTCPSMMVRSFNDPGQCSAVIDFSGLLSASDNCPGVALTSSPASGSAFPVGFTTVTVTATDASGNSSTCTFTVGVGDNEGPKMTCPPNQEIPANSGCSGSLGSWSPITLNDNCTPVGSIVVTQSPASSTLLTGHNDSTVVTLTAQDGNGVTSSCSFVVTLKDVTPPTAKCKNANVSIGAGGMVVVPPSTVDDGSFDNCGFTLTLTPDTFRCVNIGQDTVILKATDVAGNMSTCTAVITVTQNGAPSAVCQDVTIYLDDAGHAVLTPEQVDGGSSDACGMPSLSINRTQFGCSDITALQPVILTATSSNGSTSTCTAYVTVLDTVAPTANCMDITVILRPNGTATVFSANVAGLSNDNCSVTAYSPFAKVYTTANIGLNYLSITVSDWSGNSATCVSEVTVLPYSPIQGDNQGGSGKGMKTPFLFDMEVFPNPTQSDVTLAFELPYEQPILIRMFDISGRMVYSHDDLGREGANAMELRLNGVAPGLYLLEVQADGQRAVKKLLVQE
jgi:sarcosine oxidase delta subunit